MSSSPHDEVVTAPPTVDAAWMAWSSTRGQPARDELVSRYTELVRILAAKTYRNRYSAELEYADYVQFGMIGLLESIDRFNPAFGHKFETFASHRIRGAILSGVENLSEKQQQIATRKKVRAERVKSLARGNEGRERNASSQALQRLADVAVGLALGFMLDNSGMFLDGEPASGNTPYEQVELAQLRRRMSLLVQQLPPQECKVIRSHYFQHLQFEEIARSLGVTGSRVSQIHRVALARLRQMHAEAEGFAITT